MMNSSQENNLVLSSVAQRDIEGILQYTLEEYGENQAEKYKDILNQKLIAIKENSGLGHHRKDIPDRYKAYRAKEHFIIFRVDGNNIYVVRVLHGSMDFTNKV